MAFGSKTLMEHIGRGIIGFAALGLALSIMASHPWASVALLPLAIWMLRGCPICWTTGLIETIAMKILARHDALPKANEDR
ncbi:hypothetical protein [Methylovirgula sp. 4M-Z18]|uniref:hypothetical protein n=1 Tax=Methylovirgula sp. 4M-Z18 TaxID=2293567 RepID=UPI000E2F4596|nr:hypothetical protein [Methylovirgula sp. 4M-Z18]RFB80440.1 hypothetical protein DYH55_02620 [Methylovirgula sp. 4M-Z18]